MNATESKKQRQQYAKRRRWLERSIRILDRYRSDNQMWGAVFVAYDFCGGVERAYSHEGAATGSHGYDLSHGVVWLVYFGPREFLNE